MKVNIVEQTMEEYLNTTQNPMEIELVLSLNSTESGDTVYFCGLALLSFCLATSVE